MHLQEIEAFQVESKMALDDLARTFLNIVRSESQIAGECPECGETIKLGEVQWYYIPDRKEDFLADFRKKVADWEEEKQKIIKDRLRRSRSAILGDVFESLSPFLPGFKYEPADVRHIGRPIDYVCFNGLAQSREVEKITFLDIKTGKSTLTEAEQTIQEAVQDGRVEFDVVRFKPEQLTHKVTA
jgi:predicted Holliday junction resolvase-like endonuclease